jgi:hypothetical protein
MNTEELEEGEVVVEPGAVIEEGVKVQFFSTNLGRKDQ